MDTVFFYSYRRMYPNISISNIISAASSLVRVPKSSLPNPKHSDGDVVFCTSQVCIHPEAYSCRYFEHLMGSLVIKAKDNEQKESTLILFWIPSRTGESYYEVDLGRVKSIKIVYEDEKNSTGHLVIFHWEGQHKIFHFHNEGIDHLERAFAPWGFLQSKRKKMDSFSICPSLRGDPTKRSLGLQLYSVVHSFPEGTEFHPEEGVYPRLSRQVFKRLQDESGRIVNSRMLEKMLFFSGMDANVRSDVWPLLLGCYDFGMTTAERAVLREKRRRDYENLSKYKDSMTEEQAESFYNKNGCIIEKDVLRTDRTHPFFVGDQNTNVDSLREILEIYALINPDVGYVQGMSDLLSPILYVTRDNPEALWCFKGAMEFSVLINCRKSVNLDEQVMLLGELLKLIMPDFYRHTASSGDARSFSYCHRWLLVNFKREFQEEEFIKIWEACWSMHETRHFNVFVCAAILAVYGSDVADQDLDSDDVLMHFNHLAMNMDADAVLKKARCLLYEFKRMPVIPCSLCMLLSEPRDREVAGPKFQQVIECSGHLEGEICHLY